MDQTLVPTRPVAWQRMFHLLAKRPVLFDSVLLAVFCVAVFLVASHTDGVERLLHWSQTFEHLQLDELMLTLGMSSVGLTVFVARRFGDLKREMEQRLRIERRMRHMAHHDALTGLPNRLFLDDRLAEELARAERDRETIAVLCLDLDRFKPVNDVFGHAAGDSLLQQVAARMRAVARRMDTVARTGGDEFAILQPGTQQPAGAASLSARLVEAMNEPFTVCGEQVVVGVSIGIAVAAADAPPHEVLRQADIALYRAKSDGRGAFRFFEPEMEQDLRKRQSIERDLRLAIPRGEMQVHYQPQFDLESRRLVGFEALLRWRHPVRGLVMPGDFVPLAEESGMIFQLGEWALRQACTQALVWPDAITVAVNLSPVQFLRRDLVDLVEHVLVDTRLQPDRLDLEITESVLKKDPETNLAILAQLKKLGVRVTLDDFGTGYSSLNYLRRFAFDKIKIDRSFIRGLGSSPEDGAIVRAVVGLGRSLGIRSTAEGVESEEQLRFLLREGCGEVQGFLLGQPVTAGQTLEFFPAAGRRGRGDSAA